MLSWKVLVVLEISDSLCPNMKHKANKFATCMVFFYSSSSFIYKLQNLIKYFSYNFFLLKYNIELLIHG